MQHPSTWASIYTGKINIPPLLQGNTFHGARQKNGDNMGKYQQQQQQQHEKRRRRRNQQRSSTSSGQMAPSKQKKQKKEALRSLALSVSSTERQRPPLALKESSRWIIDAYNYYFNGVVAFTTSFHPSPAADSIWNHSCSYLGESDDVILHLATPGPPGAARCHLAGDFGRRSN